MKIQNKGALLFPALVNTKSGKVYGYINDKGRFVIKPRFSDAYDFNEFNVAIVRKDNLAGTINKKGEYVVNLIYDGISPYKEGRAVYSKGNGMGIIDIKGNKITKKEYAFVSDYKEGAAIIGINVNNVFLYGYIDREGNEIIPPKFLSANDFTEGLALVNIKEKEYALIDKRGNIINTYNHEYVSQFSEGTMLFADSIGGSYGFINIEGKVIINPVYTLAIGFKDGIAVVTLDELYNAKYGAIDINGKYVYEPIYNEIISLGENRVALGMPLSDDKDIRSSIFAVGDTSGNRLTDFDYLAVGTYEKGLSYASNNLFTFFIDKSGNIIKKLPKVRGSGDLRIVKNIIRANMNLSPFYLNKRGEIIYKPNDIIYLSRKYSLKRFKYNPNINYLIYIPKVMGVRNKEIEAGINKKLFDMSLYIPSDGDNTESFIITPEDVLNYNYVGDFTVIYFNKALLVLDMTGYYFPFGAAHGMPSKKTPSINLITGEFYTLGDLFMGGVNWTYYINEIINNMIKTDPQYEYVFEGAFTGIKENQSFYVDRDNLYIYFAPYEIGPYVAGFITFKIPFSEIDNIINKNGSFYRLIIA